MAALSSLAAWEIFLVLLIFPFIFFVYGIIKIVLQQGFFVPLPRNTIKEMLKLTQIKRTDLLYDIGSGDGRVAILAANEHGVKAVGIEKNVLLAWLSRRNVRKHGMQNKVRIIRDDVFNQDLRGASVVIFYLTQKLADRLRQKLKSELKRGARIVSVGYKIKDWKITKRKKVGHLNVYMYKV